MVLISFAVLVSLASVFLVLFFRVGVDRIVLLILIGLSILAVRIRLKIRRRGLEVRRRRQSDRFGVGYLILVSFGRHSFCNPFNGGNAKYQWRASSDR